MNAAERFVSFHVYVREPRAGEPALYDYRSVEEFWRAGRLWARWYWSQGITGILGMRLITRNGQTVQCYGEWRDDSNAEVLFDEEGFDGVWADGASSWEEAVEILTAYALRVGTTVVEMSAV